MFIYHLFHNPLLAQQMDYPIQEHAHEPETPYLALAS
jgi:hypothetical protein